MKLKMIDASTLAAGQGLASAASFSIEETSIAKIEQAAKARKPPQSKPPLV